MRIIGTRTATAVTCLGVLTLAACADEDNPASVAERSSTPTVPGSPLVDAGTDSTTATTEPVQATSTTTPATDPAPTSIAPAAPTPEPAPETTMISPQPAELMNNAMLQFAITDLRERLGSPDAEIDVVSVDEVDWPDGSIGCPQPGMVYTQAIVNGSKIVLRYEGVEYDYHQGGGGDVFYCPPDRSGVGTPPPAIDLDT